MMLDAQNIDLWDVVVVKHRHIPRVNHVTYQLVLYDFLSVSLLHFFPYWHMFYLDIKIDYSVINKAEKWPDIHFTKYILCRCYDKVKGIILSSRFINMLM